VPQPAFTDRRRKEIPRASVIKFFVVGGLLLVTPLVAVMNWPTRGCEFSTENVCFGSEAYKVSVTLLPYVMLIGGVIIGYNMKRISDSMNESGERRGNREEEGGGDNNEYDDSGTGSTYRTDFPA